MIDGEEVLACQKIVDRKMPVTLFTAKAENIFRDGIMPQANSYSRGILPQTDGLFVTQVCRDNGIRYYYAEKTITYTACILLP